MSYIVILSLVFYLLYIEVSSTHALHMLQQSRYNSGLHYIKWILKNWKSNFLNINLVFILFGILQIFKFESMYIFIGLYLVLTFFYIYKRKKEVAKLPLKYTHRIKRLMVTTTILYLIPLVVIYFIYDVNYLNIYYCILGFMIYINLFIVLFANVLNRPIEKLCGLYFKNKALNKLKTMPNMEFIGITGSYGKTSTKNVVYEILNSKYNVFKTPANYNTPFGLMISINDYIDKFNDYFIAEMGACEKGEIKELCDLVHPKYGILTRIGLAHLETFGSEEVIQKTKFELIESLPSDGLGILNGDDPKQLSYKIKNNVAIKWIGIDNQDVDIYAKDLKLSYKGITFTVVFKKEKKEYEFTTKLLGRNNIYNILGGIALGNHLGIDIERMQRAVSKLQPVEHRLSMTKYNDINIIDDAYNSNPMGCKMALEVLSMMPGKKMVVTPGMIEVGEKENEVNFEFGQQIADSVDEVILIGKEKTKPIYDGIISKKFDKNKIHVLNDVMDAFSLIDKLKEKETYVLLENDLPDSFSEKIRGEKK